MPTWTCATHGPVPAGEIRHLDHNSPHGHEQHECGSSAGLDWTKTKEHHMSTPDLTEYGNMARAFMIFDLYGNDRQGVSAEHDQIWAGPNPAAVSPEHRAELETLGWHPDERHETFYRFA